MWDFSCLTRIKPVSPGGRTESQPLTTREVPKASLYAYKPILQLATNRPIILLSFYYVHGEANTGFIETLLFLIFFFL